MRLLHNLGKLRASRKYASQLSPGLEHVNRSSPIALHNFRPCFFAAWADLSGWCAQYHGLVAASLLRCRHSTIADAECQPEYKILRR